MKNCVSWALTNCRWTGEPLWAAMMVKGDGVAAGGVQAGPVEVGAARAEAMARRVAAS